MAIPASIPDGQFTNVNYTTQRAKLYDMVNIVTTIPASYQSNLNATGVKEPNRGILLNSGPRSYWEHTVQSSASTQEKIILT